MSVLLFEHRNVKLLVDPVTRRVVYLTRDGIMPERVLIVGEGKQYIFSPASCEIVEFSGVLPESINAQNCWGYRNTSSGLEPVAEEPFPVGRTG